jgi:hypothetical protein
MDVIDMAGKVGFITYLMFPISMLPDGLFAFCQPRCVGRAPECVRAMFVNPVLIRRQRVEKSASSGGKVQMQ